MTEAVKTHELVERYQRFQKLQKPRTERDAAFEERLASFDSSSADGEGSQKSSAKPRAGRRYQPPTIARLGNRSSASEEQPVLSKRSKKITMRQAERMAKLAPIIEDAARRHNVPIELICGVILQESGAKTRAVSHCGAKGLMQLMPATARRFGVTDSFDPAQNIDGGTKYLRWLLDRFDGKVELALAGYNAGEGNVEKYGNKIPPFKETQHYVPAVLGYTQSMIDVFASKLSPDLPEFARRV